MRILLRTLPFSVLSSMAFTSSMLRGGAASCMVCSAALTCFRLFLRREFHNVVHHHLAVHRFAYLYLCLLYTSLVIDTVRTFFLVVLAILGPIAFAISVWDASSTTTFLR